MNQTETQEVADATGAAQSGMDVDAAKQALTGGDATLDAAADAILLRVAKFFGECVSDPQFCAVSVDERRDSEGRLLSITLVPCDDAGGQPARRTPRH